jgi:NAD(P)H-hydrate epimerase
MGGDFGMAGAVRLAGEAALRVGAGLVTVATRPEHISIISSARPEIMCHGIHAKHQLESLLKRASVIAIGPGLGQSEWSHTLFQAALASPLPKVIDADALNLLAQNPCQQNNWIITPHVGEAARLLVSTPQAIQADRISAAQQTQQKYGGIVVLKGQGTLVTDGHTLSQCQAGNPGMASGGMGDVLTGVIAGLLAQRLSLLTAAELGVCLHAAAGDEAALEGQRGLLALDLMPQLRCLINS